MQETPPYSIVEIRMLLSQYLDGALEAEQMVHLDSLMAQFPHYREEFLKLQATHGLVQNALGGHSEKQLHFTKVSDLVWKNIAAKLEADKRNQPREYDSEFVSAYYDGEISPHDPEFQAFESQLFGNADANRLLAELGQVSDAVKQFGYRLENSCTLDITQQVMNAFQQEMGLEPVSASNVSNTANVQSGRELSPELELLSAYVDQELSPRDTIEANRLIESSDAARGTLTRFNRLSEYIQQVNLQIQEQAPDCWPAISAILKRSPEEGGILIPMTRRKKLQRMARIAIPTAAAAMLLVFLMPSTKLNSSNSVAKEALSRAPAGGSVQNVVYNAGADGTELASVPADTMGQRRMGLSAPEMEAADIMSSQEKRRAESVPMPLKPLLEPSPKIAAKPLAPAAAAPAMMDAGLGKAPSSDEYLFDALNEQMPDEDISAILGK